MKNKKDPNSFKHFYQFERALPSLLIKITHDNPTATSVYMLLIRASNKLGACSVPESRIGKIIGKSTRTVNRALKYLSKNSYIAIAHNGRANVYVTNYNLVWGNYNYKKPIIRKAVTFPASVTIINSKQNRLFFDKLNKFIHNDVTKRIALDSNGDVVKPYKRSQHRNKQGRFSNDKHSSLAKHKHMTTGDILNLRAVEAQKKASTSKDNN